MRKLVQAPAKKFGNGLRAARDTSILLLLCENALRRAEVCKLNESDFDYARRELSILGKGRGLQKEKVTVSENLAACLCTYINKKHSKHTLLMESFSKSEKNPVTVADLPLFESCDRRPEYSRARLTPDGLYQLVGFYGAQIGLKRLTPHQLRHSCITAALDATKGDVRKVQKLSRHAKLATLQIYDDSRADYQGEVSALLSKLLTKKKSHRDFTVAFLFAVVGRVQWFVVLLV
jgi:integrase/recombinase XerC